MTSTDESTCCVSLYQAWYSGTLVKSELKTREFLRVVFKNSQVLHNCSLKLNQQLPISCWQKQPIVNIYMGTFV